MSKPNHRQQSPRREVRPGKFPGNRGKSVDCELISADRTVLRWPFIYGRGKIFFPSLPGSQDWRVINGKKSLKRSFKDAKAINWRFKFPQRFAINCAVHRGVNRTAQLHPVRFFFGFKKKKMGNCWEETAEKRAARLPSNPGPNKTKPNGLNWHWRISFNLHPSKKTMERQGKTFPKRPPSNNRCRVDRDTMLLCASTFP